MFKFIFLFFIFHFYCFGHVIGDFAQENEVLNLSQSSYSEHEDRSSVIYFLMPSCETKQIHEFVWSKECEILKEIDLFQKTEHSDIKEALVSVNKMCDEIKNILIIDAVFNPHRGGIFRFWKSFFSPIKTDSGLFLLKEQLNKNKIYHERYVEIPNRFHYDFPMNYDLPINTKLPSSVFYYGKLLEKIAHDMIEVSLDLCSDLISRFSKIELVKKYNYLYEKYKELSTISENGVFVFYSASGLFSYPKNINLPFFDLEKSLRKTDDFDFFYECYSIQKIYSSFWPRDNIF